MWNLDQLEPAFEIFKVIRKDPKKPLDIWWCDRGLCIFGCPSPDELREYAAREPNPSSHLAYYEGMVQAARADWTEKALERLGELCWHYHKNADEFGDVCWYLFRSD